jgi:transposase InsO family protein
MSANYSEEKGAGAGAVLQQAPRLGSGGGGYAQWRPSMDVFLQRSGAEGVHTKEMTEARWRKLHGAVAAWAQQTLDAALAHVLDGDDGGDEAGDLAAAKAEPLTEADKAARRVVTALVERSCRAYGALFHALPEELRAQVAHIPSGWAYGLWHWLETKFQSTEEDAVGSLLAQWTALHQEEDESFDAYRARVNKVDMLLDQAKEKQSRRMYAFVLLDRLQPRYRQAVLALKAGGQLKNADEIAWESVASLINQHERSELRLAATESGSGVVNIAAAMHGSAAADASRGRQTTRGAPTGSGWSRHGGSSGESSTSRRHGAGGVFKGGARGGRRPVGEPETRTCLRCERKGHIAANCPHPPVGRMALVDSSARAGVQQASAATSSSNRFESLSSDDDVLDDDDSVKKPIGKQRAFALQSQVRSPSPDSAEKRPSYADVAAHGKAAGTQPTRKAVAATTAPKPTTRVAPEPAATPGTAMLATKPGLNSSSMKVRPLAKPCAPVNSKQKLRASVPLNVALADDAWGWDSMASSCCSGNRERFISLRKCPAVPVQVADGYIVSATHTGSVPLRVTTDSGKVVRIVLDDVLYHKRFASNLLSSELLTKELGWEHHSTPESTYVVTPGGSRVTLSTRGRVAVLMDAGPERMYRALTPGAGATRDDAADVLVRLHERLCHMGWTRMMNLLHGGKVEDLNIRVKSLDDDTCKQAEKRIRECTACVQGRATRTSFGHRGLDRGSKPGECLHMDTYQIKVERDGQMVTEHGLAMTDMHSGYLWHARLQRKDEVASRVIQLVVQAETQFGCSVKRIFADGGSEFINQTLKAFCVKHGKQLHWTPARTQQLNGAAERSVRTFKDHERMMIHHAGAPMRLWSWAATHAAYVWNRTHISAGTGVTPYEAMRKKKPSVKHLSAVWGCDAYVHVPREQRSALAPKAEPCIYVGHCEEQNAANVLLLSTKQIICSRDVTYRSDSFTFMHAIQLGDDGVRDAIEFSDAELSAEHDGISSSLPAQGGHEVDPSAAHGAAAEPAEWVVESIVAERKRNGRSEYKVHWADYGSDEDTWEPEAEVSKLAAMDAWLAQKPQPRRSARNAGEPASVVVDDDERPDAEDEEPQVHMAMCALRHLQLPEEQPQQAMLKSAVAAAIASLEQRTPQTYRQAMASPDAQKWKAGLQKEFQSCMNQKVWTVMRRDQLPKGSNVLPCKVVFKLKVDEHGHIVEYKARFTPKGFRQKHGVDFFDTYARTGQYKTLRGVLSLTAKWDHELAQFDVPTAFLNADVDEEIFMELPEGFEQPGMVCKLHKSLYGLKQAPRNWDRLVHAFITGDMGFKATVSDPSLYFKRSRSGRLMLIFRFVDDMQGSYHAEDAAEFQESVALLQQRFNIKKLNTATWMLGMRIRRDRKARTITLDQELYVSSALEKYGLQQCRAVSTPEAVGAAHDANPSLDVPADRQRYMEITGTVMYAAISTRPDITHSVHYLASHMQAPTLRHMQAAERVLRYLSGTKELGMVFGSRNGSMVGDSRGRRAQVQVDVCAFADADWANDKGDRKSVSGWVAKLNGDPISWSSKKQRVVALSTCEAELYAEAAAIQEVLWLRGLMEELGLNTQTGSIVYGDNQSTLAVSHNGVKGERTKHVDVKYHFVTETVERGDVQLRWVPTAQQQADIFTKALPAPAFEVLRGQLMSR